MEDANHKNTEMRFFMSANQQKAIDLDAPFKEEHDEEDHGKPKFEVSNFQKRDKPAVIGEGIIQSRVLTTGKPSPEVERANPEVKAPVPKTLNISLNRERMKYSTDLVDNTTNDNLIKPVAQA